MIKEEWQKLLDAPGLKFNSTKSGLLAILNLISRTVYMYYINYTMNICNEYWKIYSNILFNIHSLMGRLR